MSENKQYENEYKVQAVKLAKMIGAVNAANELQIPVNTLYGWIRKARIVSFDIGCGERSPEESLILSIKLDTLTARILKLSSDSQSRIEPVPFYSWWDATDRRADSAVAPVAHEISPDHRF